MNIDIIVPCYGREEKMIPLLESIKRQSYRVFMVTLVNDCSPNTTNNYKSLVDKYSKFFNIRCVKTEVNSGQGLARQFGIDNSYADWITFADEDDEFEDNALMNLWKHSNPKIVLVNGNVRTNRDKDKYKFAETNNKNLNYVWGRLYKREYLVKNNIKFDYLTSRCFEDTYFIQLLYATMVMDPAVRIKNINEYVYIWKDGETQSVSDKFKIQAMSLLPYVTLAFYYRVKDKCPEEARLSDDFSDFMLSHADNWLANFSNTENYIEEMDEYQKKVAQNWIEVGIMELKTRCPKAIEIYGKKYEKLITKYNKKWQD